MVNDKDTEEVVFDPHHEAEEDELVDIEEAGAQKLKQLRTKLKKIEEEKRTILEEAQRERADFLNARKRLSAERELDHIRYTKRHVEALLPLCDSFEMAMSDQVAWQKADESWRRGIEGIYNQLRSILTSYKVSAIDPQGTPFDPHKHEAIGTTPVAAEQKDTVVAVLQRGYEITTAHGTEVIRPARVTIGAHTDD